MSESDQKEAFERLIEQVLTSVRHVKLDDTGLTLQEALTKRFRKEYESPRVKDFGLVLMRNVSGPDVRRMLFFPTPVDMREYGQLIAAAPAGAVEKHPQNTVQVTALACLYMIHSKSWPLMREFVLAGGLRTLTAQFTLENPFLRSQAIDTFLLLTGDETYNWFKPPSTDEDRLLHQRLLELARTPFLQRLVANYDCPFPQGSFYCLQIMAFWLSWARKLHSGGEPLSLSSSLLETLKRWSTRSDDGVGDDERDLAKRLHDDFSRFPTAEEMAAKKAKEAGGEKDGQTSRVEDVTDEVAEAEAEGEAEGGEDDGVSSLLMSIDALKLESKTDADDTATPPAAVAADPPAVPTPTPEPSSSSTRVEIVEDDDAEEEPDTSTTTSTTTTTTNADAEPEETGGSDSDADSVSDLSPAELAVYEAILRRADYGGNVKGVGMGTTEFDPTVEAALLGKVMKEAQALSAPRRRATDSAEPLSQSGSALAAAIAMSREKKKKKASKKAAKGKDDKKGGGGGGNHENTLLLRKLAGSKPSKTDDSKTKTKKTKTKKSKDKKVARGPGMLGAGVPSTSRLETEWKKSGRDPAKFAPVLGDVSPSDLPSSFGQSLSEDMLVALIKTLGHLCDDKPEFVYKSLAQITSIPRFTTIVMFLDAAAKAEAATLLTKAEAWTGADSPLDSLRVHLED